MADGIHEERRGWCSFRLGISGAVAAVAFAFVVWSLASTGSEEAARAEGEVLILHVSVNGSDGAAATVDAPLATLEGARDRIRELRRSKEWTGSVVVSIEGGIYERHNSFELTAVDSGTSAAPIIYRGVPPKTDAEPVRLVGGRRVQSFVSVTDSEILQRLPEVAWGHVVEANLPAQGIRSLGSLERRGFTLERPVAGLELFLNHQPMPLARWPNVGWATIHSIPGPEAEEEAARTIGFSGEHLKRWAEAPDPWAFGYWYHGWADEHTPITAVDVAGETMTFGARHQYGYRKGQRFFVYNLLEELDSPGEWYLDRATGTLYFWPPDDVDLEQAEVLVSVLEEPLIQANGASHIRIENLVLEGTRDSAVRIRGGTRVELAGCTIRNVGRDGVSIHEGSDHAVLSSDLYHIGERGIRMVGGNRQTLQPGGHRAANNHIHHFSRWSRTYRAAIQLSGVGNTAEHNLIHDGPHLAINFGGNDHRIAFNEIHHVLTETDDAGALYIGRDWSARGHVIEHNIIRHSGSHHARDQDRGHGRSDEPGLVYGPVALHGTSLVYLDDLTSGVTIRGNLLHDGGRTIMIGGGRDNVVEGNIIIGGARGIRMDGRGLTWASEMAKPDGRWGMWDRLRAVPFAEPLYRNRYPVLAELPDNDPYAPVGNRIARNIVVDAESALHFLHDVKPYAILDSNHLIQGRVNNPAALSRADLVALAGELAASTATEGCCVLPLDRVGLHLDEYRRR